MDHTDRLINDFLTRLQAEQYVPEWEFAATDAENGDQLYALPYTQAQKDQWGKGSYFAHDEDRYLTSQGLYTGQWPEAIPITEEQARGDPRFTKDWEVWQEHLGNLQTRRDPFNPLGDQFSSALAALGMAAGGAALFGGFAPAAAGAAGAGAAGSGGYSGLAGTPALLDAYGIPGAAIATGGGLGSAAGPLAAGGAGLAGAGGAGAAVAGGGAGAVAPAAAAAGGGTLATLGGYAPLISAGLGGLGSLIGGVQGADAARDAAETQADAARDANALLASIYSQNRADQEPYRQAGYAALNQLQGLAGQPGDLPAYTSTSVLDPSPYNLTSQLGNARFHDPIGVPRAEAYRYTPGAAPSAAAYHYTPSQAVSAGAHRYDPAAAVSAGAHRYDPASFLRPEAFTFTPPSGEQLLAEDPGYQFRLDQGRKALEASAAARGGLFSGATGQGLTDYAQGLASQEYGQAYGRARDRNLMEWERAALANMTNEERQRYANQAGYQRAGVENLTNEERQRYANQAGWERANVENLSNEQRQQLANQTVWERVNQQAGTDEARRLQALQMAWQTANQESDTTFNRALTGNQLDWERLVGATGMDYSKTLQHNQDTAARNFQQWQANTANQMGQRQQRFNELASLSGTGQTSNSLLANLGANLGGQQAANVTSAGAANAAGGVGAANAWNNALTGLGTAAGSYLQNNYLQQQLQQQNQQNALLSQLMGSRTR